MSVPQEEDHSIGSEKWVKYVKIWKNVLRTIGVLYAARERNRFFPEGLHIFLSISILTAYLFLLLKTAALTSKTDLSSAILAMNFALLAILALLLTGSLYMNRKGIDEVDATKYDIPRFFNYETRFDPDHKIYNTVFYLASEYILTPLPIIAVAVILIVPSLIGQDSGGKIWTNENGVNRRLQINVWLPFKSDEGITFFILYLTQIYYVVFVASVYASAEILQIGISKLLLKEMEILAESIRNLDERVRRHYYKEIGAEDRYENETDLYNDPVFQKSARFCIVENIKHHQSIMEYFRAYSRLLNFPAFFAYVCGTGFIAMGLISLTAKKNQNNGDFFNETTVMLLFFLIEETLFMFYLSWIGEQIVTVGTEINREVQFINLDKYDNKFRKHVVLFLLGTTRDMISKSGGCFDCNMEAFSSVINASYSFYNVTNAS